MARKHSINDIVQVPLDQNAHAYALVLSGASYAFYDKRFTSDIPSSEISKLPIAFFAAVMNSAKKRWPYVTKVEGTTTLVVPPKFIQDPLNKSSFSLYWNDGRITKASREDCNGLERAAVWDPEQIEERLRDHFAGRPNKFVESMKIDHQSRQDIV